MHRKEVTHSSGSYERKSRGRKLADEMGRGKIKSYYTLIDWRTGREWPLNCMKFISARWRSHRPFQRKWKRHIPIAKHRKKLRKRGGVSISLRGSLKVDELNRGHLSSSASWSQEVVEKATPGRRCSGWAAMENDKDTTLTAITSGSKYFSYVRSPAPSHTQSLNNPFETYK